MIVELRGRLIAKDLESCVIDVGGVGYGVEMSRLSLEQLGELDVLVHVYTHLVIREDAWRLIGFISRAERQCFVDMLAVSGVGTKGALALLGHLGVDGVREAVVLGQWKTLKEAPGIGAKLAQRIQLELSTKWATIPQSEGLTSKHNGSGALLSDEVLSGLVGLGYSLDEARAACDQISKDVEDPGQRLRAALKLLDRTKGARLHGG
ncbi:MAG: Holliday junction branch migration protein RuvA [Sulfobacillus sp.]